MAKAGKRVSSLWLWEDYAQGKYWVNNWTKPEKDETVRIDINFCDKKGCRFSLQGTSYAFYDRKNRGFYLYQLPRDFMKDYSICGFCEDLQHIDKLPVVHVR